MHKSNLTESFSGMEPTPGSAVVEHSYYKEFNVKSGKLLEVSSDFIAGLLGGELKMLFFTPSEFC